MTIYLDNNATTPLLPAVWDAMQPLCHDNFGNPASSHGVGRRARRALEDARETTAKLLGALTDEVIFTSGATEANNLALFGLAASNSGRHVLVSAIEHPCVIEPAEQLVRRGFLVEQIRVDADGVVQLADFQKQLQSETTLVAVMLANHETGALQPIKELVSQVPPGTPFHCDAAAAAGKMPIDFHNLGVTSLTISAHKFHGPQGVGALLLRGNTPLQSLQFGGHQQHAKRPGTEPVALAVGLAKALEIAVNEMDQRQSKIRQLRQIFLGGLRAQCPPVILNGPADGGLPHTVNLSFPGCAADVMLMSLDLAGVACSTGSACSSGSLLPSPVLQAMGVADEALRSALRFSFSHLLSEEEIVEAVGRVAMVVRQLRGQGI